MRRTATLVLVCGLVACARSSTPGTSSRIFGSVTAGPMCPVERVDSPCPPVMWTGEVRATNQSGRTFDAQTDDHGTYTLTLAPGTYEVVPVTSGGPPTGRPVSVVVIPGAAQRVDLTVDTGIR